MSAFTQTGQASALLLLLGLGACTAASFTGPREPVPTDSLTAQRILGTPAEVPPLLPAPGNVWPTEEQPRATLGSPEIVPRAGDPVPPLARRGSSTPPDLLAPGTDVSPAVRPYPTAPMAPVAPLAPRREGQVIPTPQGPAVTTGGGAGYSTYNTPGGASGIAVPQGATTTLLGQDGTVRQVPTPR
ncbi:hypothetical protein [Roseomonas sp. 18066]|uniref:hypothetical protein n=1 Tax=Roseomonas sp. 18066 TaxID=2681412 RepID=UPI00135C2DE4|nr:hypothetical protein [Roseomonas sp. 18066]